MTLASENHVPDEVYDEVRQACFEKELVDLTIAVVAIKGWNRASIAFRASPQITGSNKAD